MALECGLGCVPDFIGNEPGTAGGDYFAALGLGRSTTVLEDASIDWINDEIPDAARAPEPLCLLASGRRDRRIDRRSGYRDY